MESRRAIRWRTVYCPKCQKEMTPLSYKTRIPKRERKLWIEFLDWLSSKNPYYKEKFKRRLIKSRSCLKN
jgi:hypothetical protein